MAELNANVDVMEVDDAQLHEHFAEVLRNVVGLTDAQVALLQRQGINVVTDLIMVDETILLEIFAGGRNPLTAMNKMKLLSLRMWTITNAQGVVGREAYLDPRGFDAHTCQQIQLKLAMKGKSDKSVETKATSIGKLDSFSGKMKDWDVANRKLTSYLGQCRNSAGIPLTYVIRTEADCPNELEDGMQGDIWRAPLEGPTFDNDNYQVFQVLLQWTADGTAETHVDAFKTSNDGRAAYQTLVVNYEGDDAKQAMIARARYNIAHAHYENDTTNFTFQDYCTKHLAAQNDLKRRGVEMDGPSQVDAFLKGIKREQYNVIKPVILASPTAKGSLLAATVTFKSQLQSLFNYPYNLKQGQNMRKIGAMRGRGRYGGRGGRGNYDNYGGGRGRAYGGRGFNRDGGRGRGGGSGSAGGGRSYHANDDRLYIEPKILNNLSPLHRAMLFKGRDEMRKRDSESQTNNDTRSVKAVKSEESEEPTEASNDNNMNAASDKFGKRNLGNARKQGGLSTSERRTIASFQASTPVNCNVDYQKEYRLEIDSRADTTCCGKGFVPIADVDQVCDVSGFHPSMPVMKNVPIRTCATAYDHPSGETFILYSGIWTSAVVW